MWKTTRACTPPDKFRRCSSSSSSSPSLTTSPSCLYLCQRQLVLPSEKEEQSCSQHNQKLGRKGGVKMQNCNNYQKDLEEELQEEYEEEWEEEEEEEEQSASWQEEQEISKLNRNFTVNRHFEEEENTMTALATINEGNLLNKCNHAKRVNNVISEITEHNDTFHTFTTPNAEEHNCDNNVVENEENECTSFIANLSRESTSFQPCSTSDDITSSKYLPLCIRQGNLDEEEQEYKPYSRQQNYYIAEKREDNLPVEKEQELKEHLLHEAEQEKGWEENERNRWSNFCDLGAEPHATKNAVLLNVQQTNTTKSPSYEYVLPREPQLSLENANNDDDDTIGVYETPYLQRTETHCFIEQNVDDLPTLVPSLLYTPQVDPERISLRAALDHELDLINEAHKYTMLDPITTLIEDELYIGGFPDEHTLAELRSKKIKNVINCCSCDYVSDAVFKQEFNVIELACYDQDDYLILHTDYELFRQILTELIEQRHERVFVHCIAGVNRSVTLCAAYLIDRLHISPIDAIRHFRTHGRMHILDNKYFRHQLVDHYLQSAENANIRISTRLSLEQLISAFKDKN